jgi:hypothetical protein
MFAKLAVRFAAVLEPLDQTILMDPFDASAAFARIK